MINAKLIAAAVAALLLIVVILQNTEDVETRVLFVTITMPRAVLIFISALFGFVVGAVAGMFLSTPKKQPDA